MWGNISSVSYINFPSSDFWGEFSCERDFSYVLVLWKKEVLWRINFASLAKIIFVLVDAKIYPKFMVTRSKTWNLP